MKAEFDRRWLDEGVLVRDPVPALYFLEQAFSLPGGRMRRRSGFIVACRLEDFGGSVLPHERTHAGPKEDRLRLMKATGMMFSQIFSLYADPARVLAPVFDAVEAGPPALEVLHDGVVNRLRVCTDEALVLAAAEFLRSRTVLIADGHHRYETALAYRNHMRLRDPGHHGNEPYNFVPMFFTNEADAGTVVLPTHRLLHGVKAFSREAFLGDLRKYFSVVAQPSHDAMIGRLESGPGREFGLAFPDGRECWLLRAGPEAARLVDHAPVVLSRIDAVLLHSAVFGSILGLSEESQERNENLEFERDPSEVLRMMRHAARYQAAFCMKAPQVAQVRAAAEAGGTLPQKTTFFYSQAPLGTGHLCIRHKSEDFSDVRVAEFFLGPYWENKVFPAIEQDGFIGISTSAYGTFLCICRVTFTDGTYIYLERYIDFEMQRRGGTGA